jgi:hypothetical protein
MALTQTKNDGNTSETGVFMRRFGSIANGVTVNNYFGCYQAPWRQEGKSFNPKLYFRIEKP